MDMSRDNSGGPFGARQKLSFMKFLGTAVPLAMQDPKLPPARLNELCRPREDAVEWLPTARLALEKKMPGTSEARRCLEREMK